jgi:hypothetical protein
MVLPAASQAQVLSRAQFGQVSNNCSQILVRTACPLVLIRLNADYTVSILGVVIRDALYRASQRIHALSLRLILLPNAYREI